ncbi:endonuclease/Exonuclease/phosphatase [Apiospora hydei]|uniref:polynucleotide adenylyltransferase n=1 Tax=Apiospora hydei TaxID=1337664 RepID=A0ABR1WAD7_9PEZI
MAATGDSPGSTVFSVGSHDTALCIIPPRHLWPSLDSLRSLYDKAHERWPPHINLAYPFVKAGSLPQAAAQISDRLRSRNAGPDSGALPISLDVAGVFTHRHDNTIFIHDSSEDHTKRLIDTRAAILDALGQTSEAYRMHLTIGQSEDVNSDLHKFLLQKANLLPPMEWEAGELCILLRERTQRDSSKSSEMKLWGTISLNDFSVVRCSELQRFGRIRIPPSQSRYPILIKNVLERHALSDILVLQEVTDDFLSYLLKDSGIREKYPFTTSGPPDQFDVEPLPSHLNVVVLSRWSFKWDWVSFKRKHKGSVVLQFRDIGREEGDTFLPLVLATVHLTCGMTDGSVAAKKGELQAVVKYLSQEYTHNPWVLAGDFNMTTSAFTIDAALKKKAISPQTSKYLSQMEAALTESRLSDAWTEARLDNLDRSVIGQPNDSQGAFEGETGATFDPTVNELASQIVGAGFNNRPQRYDRILFKGHGLFSIAGFNMFGQEPGDLETSIGTEVETRQSYGSDHWGIRCILKINPAEQSTTPGSTTKLVVPVEPQTATTNLANVHDLKEVLEKRNIVPSEDDISKRKLALDFLRSILLDGDREESATQSRSKLSLVLVSVGSYGLDVWTASSDIDCLCIGSISSKTFFALATQRLRRASSNDARILRRVNANSGTMLELEVKGVKMDLQYCPSTWIAESWPQAMRLQPNDPAFSLSMHTLAKLKPVRDLYYLRQTIPDLAAFRTAHYVVKTWAKQRGIYAGKFGYLNGIQISVLLARICKLLFHDSGSTSVPTILTTFFHHYANFDWTTQMVFDPFFYKSLRYVRTAREPMAILGFHPPSLNTALAASTPSVRTIAEEFQKANEILCSDGATWSGFLGDHDRVDGALDFLKTYKSYVKIDVQFWGISLAKGSQYVGWLESRCVMLLVDLSRRIPNIHARMWPARFVGIDSSDEETDYQGCYLIGLDQLETSDEATKMSKEDLKVALGGLQTALQNFEGRIRGDEIFFDAKTSWMSASVVKQAELGELKLDQREWGEYTIGDDESDEEEEEEGVDDEDEYTEEERPKAKSKKTAGGDVEPPRPAYEGKFRSSADVISRLRWDPNLDSGDFIVGYEDRFLGAKERALDLWKSEQTDEEFIPQHRVLYFKRKSDGVIVWDRKARRDMLFGSGVKDSDA